MSNYEQITEIIDDMDLNRPYVIHIDSQGRMSYRVTIECDGYNLTAKTFQSAFNRIEALVYDFIFTLDYIEFIVKCYDE